MIEVRLDGLSYDGLLKDLAAYGEKSRKAIRTAVVKTCYSTESTAKKRLRGMMGSAKHWITGRLASSVHTEIEGINNYQSGKDSMPGDGNLDEPIGFLNGVVGTNVDYGPSIEFGSKPHVIKARNAKALAFKIGGLMIFRKSVNHPGFKGESYLRYAAEVEEKKFPERIETELNKLV